MTPNGEIANPRIIQIARGRVRCQVSGIDRGRYAESDQCPLLALPGNDGSSAGGLLICA